MIRKRDLIVIMALFLVALIPLTTYALSPDGAKAELEKMGFAVTDAAFSEAVAWGDPKVVSLFLDAGMDADTRNKSGDVAIITAAKMGHEKVLSLLLEYGADPDAVERNDWTALMYAAVNHDHDPQKVMALIEAGANINWQDKMDGRTALMEASVNGHLNVVKLLLKGGADIGLKDTKGNTALDLAKQMKWKRIIDAIEMAK